MTSSRFISPPAAPELPSTTPLKATAPQQASKGGRIAWWIVTTLLLVTGLLTLSYAVMSFYIATQIVQVPQNLKPIKATPGNYGLRYQEVTFKSRLDGVTLRGWFIPGVRANGSLTAQRVILVVPGARQNRSDMDAGALPLSAYLAQNGFAVLAFDPRGTGASEAAPFSMGFYEPRDVLGAVDFLQTGALPYPALGRPEVIGAWGISNGANSVLLAAAQEPNIRAIVSDTAAAIAAPLLEEQVIAQGGIPAFFVPGGFVAARVLYGIDYYSVRPVDVVAKLAPRPIFFIQGAKDPWLSSSNLAALTRAANVAPNAHVQMWIVPGVVEHAQSFHTTPAEYARRVAVFFAKSLGPDNIK